MKKSQTPLKEQLKPVLNFIVRYKKFLFVITVLLLVTFLVYRINQFSNTTPSESTIDEQLQTVALPKFDPHVLESIQKLQNQNVEVRSLFDQARNNPFNE